MGEKYLSILVQTTIVCYIGARLGLVMGLETTQKKLKQRLEVLK